MGITTDCRGSLLLSTFLAGLLAACPGLAYQPDGPFREYEMKHAAVWKEQDAEIARKEGRQQPE